MTIKKKQLYDLCEMYRSGINAHSGIKSIFHKATLYTNIPYALAKFKKRVAEQDKRYSKGTFFKIVKNGESPIKIKK